MKKSNFLGVFALLILFSNVSLAQKTEVFSTFIGSSISRYKVTTANNVEDYKFESLQSRRYNDSKYETMVTSYKGKNEKGEHTWLMKRPNDTDVIITLLNGGGLKESKSPYDTYYGKVHDYIGIGTASKEKVHLVVTGEKIVMLLQDAEDHNTKLDMKGNDFTGNFNSKKDFTISAFNVNAEKEVKISFKKKKNEFLLDSGKESIDKKVFVFLRVLE